MLFIDWEKERERARSKLQVSDEEMGVQRAAGSWSNISLGLCQRTEVSREVMAAFERPWESFGCVEVHSVGGSHGSLL